LLLTDLSQITFNTIIAGAARIAPMMPNIKEAEIIAVYRNKDM